MNMERSKNYKAALGLLSEHQAKRFLRDKLRIFRFDAKFRDNPKALLRDIMIAWQEVVPFQNVTQLAQEPAQRRMPTMPENVAAMMTLKGGTCWTHSTSLHVLLTVLGYDARLVGGATWRPGDNHSHVFVVVKGLDYPQSTHIAEVTWTPVSDIEPISLDFDTESDVITGVYTPYKYIRYKKWYVRCHHKGDSYIAPEARVIDDWVLVHYFKLKEKTYDQLACAMYRNVYSDKSDFFNTELMALREDNRCFLLYLRGKVKMEKKPGGEVITTRLHSLDDVINAISFYFPTLEDEEVRNAVKNCNKSWLTEET